jgi:polar amino acid transport system permease protein
MMVAYIAFIVNYTAYFIEIIRAGIESLPKDQFESALVMGCRPLTMYRYIIMPQALRSVLPIITNEVITLIKDTSLVTVIAISDLMRNVKEVVSRDFTLSPFIIATVFYLLFSFLIVKIFRHIEKANNYIESQV